MIFKRGSIFVMKETSIFKKVLLSNLKIVMVPIVIIMFFAGFIITDSFKRDITHEAEIAVSKFAESMNAEIEKVITITENTARYPLVYNGLNADYKNHYSVFIYLDEVKVFLDNLTYELSDDSLTICFKNETLYGGKYFVPANDLKEYDSIQKRLDESETNILWEEDVFKDGNGREYFQFYVDMPLNSGCFIIGKVYIPDSDEDIYVVKSGEDPKDGYSGIRANINSQFDAVGRVSQGRIFSIAFQVYAVLIIITVMILLMLYYITQKTTDKVTRDINEFIGRLNASSIANEELDLEIKSGEATEISIIKETISRLLTQINEITNSNHNTEMEKKTLEFELLQSQIDPHTLYNSLSAIRLGAFKRQDTEMVNFVDTMVSYYRKVLNKGKTISTISDELDLITKYVRINELSHYKKYNLYIDCDDGLMSVETLHLLLQPFVENAIIHGLGGSKKDCEIRIKCYRDNGKINISVADNGRGMDAEKLAHLNDIEKCELGYGIRNAFMRLKLYYGDAAYVHFESEYGKGTCVYICYPI